MAEAKSQGKPTSPLKGEVIPWHDRLINVNFPAMPLSHIKGLKVCPMGRRKLEDNLDRRTDPQGRPYLWIGGQRTVPFHDHPESDIRAIAEGYITITPLSLDMTDYGMLEVVRGVVDREPSPEEEIEILSVVDQERKRYAAERHD